MVLSCMGQADTFPEEVRQRALRDDKLLARAGTNRSYRDRLVGVFDEQAYCFSGVFLAGLGGNAILVFLDIRLRCSDKID
jgi:hypothetical protein